MDPTERLGAQSARFVLNGLIATAVHFGLLALFVHALQLRWAGVSNVLAALGATVVSFVGNRHYVFRAQQGPAWVQVRRFWLLYLTLSAMQGIVLFLWTDLGGLDYRAGFLLGALLQAVCTFFGGRHWVFRPQN